MRDCASIVADAIPLIEDKGEIIRLLRSIPACKLGGTEHETLAALVGRTLALASPKFKEDKEVMTAAVETAGMALQFASDVLKGDMDLVLCAINDDPFALECADASLDFQGNKKLILKLITERANKEPELSYSGMNIYMVRLILGASPNFREDKTFMMVAVEANGMTLKLASEELQEDPDVVMRAVETDGLALEHASETLKNNRDVVMRAVESYGMALEFASDRLLNNKEVVLCAIESDWCALSCASEELTNDKQVVLRAVERDGMALEFASETLQNDKEVVMCAVDQNGDALTFCSVALSADEEVVMLALAQDDGVLDYASMLLQRDEGFLRRVAKKYPMALRYGASDYFVKVWKSLGLADPYVVAEEESGHVIKGIGWWRVRANAALRSCTRTHAMISYHRCFIDICEHIVGLSKQTGDKEITMEQVEGRPDPFCTWMSANDVNTVKIIPKISSKKLKESSTPDELRDSLVGIMFDGVVVLEIACNHLCPLLGIRTLDQLVHLLKPFDFKICPPSPRRKICQHIKDIHPRNYIFDSENQCIGYKKDQAIFLASGKWLDHFNDIKSTASDELSPCLRRAITSAMESVIFKTSTGITHFSVPKAHSFEAVLHALHKKDRHALETCLSQWLLEYSCDKNHKQHVAECKNYLCAADRDLDRDPMYKHMTQMLPLSCKKRCEIFMAIMEHANFADNYCIIKNDIHAWIASKNKAIDLDGTPVNLSFYEPSPSPAGLPAPTFHPLEKIISNSDDSAQLPCDRHLLPFWVQSRNVPAMLSPSLEFWGAATSSNLDPMSDPPRKELSPTTEAALPLVEILIAKAVRPPDLLPQNSCSTNQQQKALIIGESIEQVRREVSLMMEQPVLVLPKSGRYNRTELEQYIKLYGNRCCIVFDVSAPTNKKDIDKMNSVQIEYKKAVDTKVCERQLRGVCIGETSCYYYIGTRKNPPHLLASLISRVSDVYRCKETNKASEQLDEASEQLDKASEQLDEGDPKLSAPTLDGAFTKVEVKPHKLSSEFYQVSQSLPKGLEGKLIEATSSSEKMSVDRTSKVKKLIYVEVNKIMPEDPMVIARRNDEISRNRPIWLAGEWYYANENIEFVLSASPHVIHDSWTLVPKPYETPADPSSESPNTHICLSIEKTNNANFPQAAHTRQAHEKPLCEGACKEIIITSDSCLWVVKRHDLESEGSFSKFTGEKTALCVDLESKINQGIKIQLSGFVSMGFVSQLRTYFHHFTTMITLNGKPMMDEDPWFKFNTDNQPTKVLTFEELCNEVALNDESSMQHHAAINVKGPHELYSCLHQEATHRVAYSLREYLANPRGIKTVIINGHSTTIEEKEVLGALLKRTFHAPYAVYCNNSLCELPNDCHSKFYLINHISPIDGAENTEAKVDSTYKSKFISLVSNHLSEPKKDDEDGLTLELFAALSLENYLLAEKIKGDGVKDNVLTHLFGDPKTERAPLSPSDCGGAANSALPSHADIRKEIRFMIGLLRQSSQDHGLGFGVLLTGPPGIGKTLLATKLAEQWGVDYSMFDGSPRDDEIDQLKVKYRNGGVVIINEYENPCWSDAINRLEAEPIVRHRNFFVIASSNATQTGKMSFPIIDQPPWNLMEKVEYLKFLLSRYTLPEYDREATISTWLQGLAPDHSSFDARRLLNIFNEWCSTTCFLLNGKRKASSDRCDEHCDDRKRMHTRP